MASHRSKCIVLFRWVSIVSSFFTIFLLSTCEAGISSVPSSHLPTCTVPSKSRSSPLLPPMVAFGFHAFFLLKRGPIMTSNFPCVVPRSNTSRVLTSEGRPAFGLWDSECICPSRRGVDESFTHLVSWMESGFSESGMSALWVPDGSSFVDESSVKTETTPALFINSKFESSSELSLSEAEVEDDDELDDDDDDDDSPSMGLALLCGNLCDSGLILTSTVAFSFPPSPIAECSTLTPESTTVAICNTPKWAWDLTSWLTIFCFRFVPSFLELSLSSDDDGDEESSFSSNDLALGGELGCCPSWFLMTGPHVLTIGVTATVVILAFAWVGNKVSSSDSWAILSARALALAWPWAVACSAVMLDRGGGVGNSNLTSVRQ